VTGMPARDIDIDLPLQRMGLDSLLAVDLRNRLTQALPSGVRVPATLVFDHPSVVAITDYLEVELGALAPDSGAVTVGDGKASGSDRDAMVRPPASTTRFGPSVGRTPTVAPTDHVNALDDLSDDEIDALFADRTRKP